PSSAPIRIALGLCPLNGRTRGRGCRSQSALIGNDAEAWLRHFRPRRCRRTMAYSHWLEEERKNSKPHRLDLHRVVLRALRRRLQPGVGLRRVCPDRPTLHPMIGPDKPRYVRGNRPLEASNPVVIRRCALRPRAMAVWPRESRGQLTGGYLGAEFL